MALYVFDVFGDGALQLPSQDIIERLRAIGAAADGASVALIFGEVVPLGGAVQVQKALGCGAIVIEPQIPVIEPLERSVAVIGETAQQAIVATELSALIARADSPMEAPGHIEPRIPAADEHPRVMPDRLELRGIGYVLQKTIIGRREDGPNE